jgi:Holliday junction resolvase-like predicted endonuclease
MWPLLSMRQFFRSFLQTRVSRRQLANLRSVARIWIAENREVRARGFRFDVVAVVHGGEERGSEIRHLVGVG